MYLSFSICQIEDVRDTDFFRSWWESPWSKDVVSEGQVRACQGPSFYLKASWVGGTDWGYSEPPDWTWAEPEQEEVQGHHIVRMPRWPQIHVTRRGVIRSIALTMGVNMK